MLDRGMQNRRILDRTVAAAGAELHPAIEVDTVGGLYAQMAGARWSSIIPHTWLHAFGLPAGMCAVPLHPQPSTPPVGVLVRSDKHGEPIVAAALLDAIRDLDAAAVLEHAVTAATDRTG